MTTKQFQEYVRKTDKQFEEVLNELSRAVSLNTELKMINQSAREYIINVEKENNFLRNTLLEINRYATHVQKKKNATNQKLNLIKLTRKFNEKWGWKGTRKKGEKVITNK